MATRSCDPPLSLAIRRGGFRLTVAGDLGRYIRDLLRGEEYGFSCDPGPVVDLGHLLQHHRPGERRLGVVPDGDGAVVLQQARVAALTQDLGSISGELFGAVRGVW